MRSPADRFIAAATQPFADNPELEIAAGRELREMIEHAGGEAKGDSLVECAERLEAKPARRGLWICLAMAVLGLVLVGYGAWGIYREREWLHYTADPMAFPDRDAPEAYLSKDLSPAQRLLLFGNSSETNRTKRLEKLWKSQPDRIDLFHDYASSHLAERRSLPPGFRGVVDRLDQENGYFLMMEAAAIGKDSVAPAPLPSRRLPRPLPPPSWIIKDRSKLEESLQHLERAVAAAHATFPAGQLEVERLAAIPRPTSNAGRLARAFYFGYKPSGGSELLDLTKVVGAKAELCGKENDPEGLRRLIATWEGFESRFYPADTRSLLVLVMSRSISYAVRENMIAAAKVLGMADEAKRLEATSAKLKDLRRKREKDPVRKQHTTELREKGTSLLVASSIVEEHRPESAPAITPPEFKPGRMVEYALADRAGAVVAWLILTAVMVCTLLYRFRSGALCRKISGRLHSLLRPADHFRIAASCIAPLIALLVLHQSWLGGREWSPSIHGMTLPAGQLLAALLLMMVLPLIVARSRIAARGARLGLSGKAAYLDWVVVLCCLAAILVLGIAGNRAGPGGDRFFFGDPGGVELDITEALAPHKAWLIAAATLLSLAAMVLAARGMMAIFSSRETALHRVVVSRALVPAYLAGMLAITLTIPLHQALERYWVNRDHLLDATPESVPLSNYEWGVVRSAKNELLQTLQAND